MFNEFGKKKRAKIFVAVLHIWNANPEWKSCNSRIVQIYSSPFCYFFKGLLATSSAVSLVTIFPFYRYKRRERKASLSFLFLAFAALVTKTALKRTNSQAWFPGGDIARQETSKEKHLSIHPVINLHRKARKCRSNRRESRHSPNR